MPVLARVSIASVTPALLYNRDEAAVRVDGGRATEVMFDVEG